MLRYCLETNNNHHTFLFCPQETIALGSMIHDEVQDIAMANQQAGETPLKQWRSQLEANHLQTKDVVQFLEQSSASFYTTVQKEPSKTNTHTHINTDIV